jgi:hypothetical protein
VDDLVGPLLAGIRSWSNRGHLRTALVRLATLVYLGRMLLKPQHLAQLLVAKDLLRQADVTGDMTDAGAMSVVILYDLVVDVAAKAALDAMPPRSLPGTGYKSKKARASQLPTRDSYLPEVLDGVLGALRISRNDDALVIPELDEVRRLHEFRNKVQHNGVVPIDHRCTAQPLACA